MLVAVIVVLIPGAPLVPILFLTQALNAVLLLVMLPFIRSLGKDRELMGAHALGTHRALDDRHRLRPDRGLGGRPRRSRGDLNRRAQTPRAKLSPSMTAAPSTMPALGPSRARPE